MKYAVVPKEIVSHYGSDFRSHPIGTGPFQLKLWEENVKLVLRKTLILWTRKEMHCLI
jgi:peptide/nickel transport system substrate-binding protein